ncbi:MAG: DUF2807 domain-containing protein [Legionellaceae bacterium]|nr:DUF2807 domain-containing protein [Legionellaceae bacterium]
MKISRNFILALVAGIFVVVFIVWIIDRDIITGNRSTLSSFHTVKANTIYGAGNRGSISRTYPSIRTVRVTGPFTVILKKGTKNRISVNADDNILHNIQFTIINTIVQVSPKNNAHLISDNSIEVIIESSSINSLLLAGNAVFEAHDLSMDYLKIHAVEDVKIDISGQIDTVYLMAENKVQIKATNMKSKIIRIFTSGDTTSHLNGKSEQLYANIKDSSVLDAKDLICIQAILYAYGRVNCAVHATRELNINSTGVSNAVYYGNPTHIKKNATGFYQIKHIN